jgi:hypothetical protein
MMIKFNDDSLAARLLGTLPASAPSCLPNDLPQRNKNKNTTERKNMNKKQQQNPRPNRLAWLIAAWRRLRASGPWKPGSASATGVQIHNEAANRRRVCLANSLLGSDLATMSPGSLSAGCLLPLIG